MITFPFNGQDVRVPESVAEPLQALLAKGVGPPVGLHLFTHEAVGEVDPVTGGKVVHEEFVLPTPSSVAWPVAKLFFDNPEGDTSVHDDTVAAFAL